MFSIPLFQGGRKPRTLFFDDYRMEKLHVSYHVVVLRVVYISLGGMDLLKNCCLLIMGEFPKFDTEVLARYPCCGMCNDTSLFVLGGL